MKINEAIELRNVLDRLIEANEALEKLTAAKKLQTEEWQTFLSRSQAQLLQLHGRIAYAAQPFLLKEKND